MNLKYTLFFLSSILLYSCSDNDDSKETPNQNLEFEYKLAWSDEFDGNEINKDNWSFVLWEAGKVNNEWQKYVEHSDNYKVEDGKLHITAKQTSNTNFDGYTSTRLTSKTKQEFKYGRIEFRAKMPYGRGTWPALWMLGSNYNEVGWPKCGEIDIMEYVGFQPNTTHTNVHTQYQYGDTNFHVATNLETAEEEFHKYGIIWTKDKIQFYVDSITNITNTYSPSNKTPDNWPFTQPFYFIMNFAVGGIWGGKEGVDEDIWPQTMVVDYVRVYQLKPIKND